MLGEGQNLETVPAHLFFRIFDRQMDLNKDDFEGEISLTAVPNR